MKLGIDLDGTALRYPDFFSKLTQLWDDDIYILTFRTSMENCIDDCRKHNIKYKEIILANRDDSKAKEIERLGIEVFFDDMPEFSRHVSPECAVFHVRNEENFDFNDKKYLFSEYTGKIFRY